MHMSNCPAESFCGTCCSVTALIASQCLPSADRSGEESSSSSRDIAGPTIPRPLGCHPDEGQRPPRAPRARALLFSAQNKSGCGRVCRRAVSNTSQVNISTASENKRGWAPTGSRGSVFESGGSLDWLGLGADCYNSREHWDCQRTVGREYQSADKGCVSVQHGCQEFSREIKYFKKYEIVSFIVHNYQGVILKADWQLRKEGPTPNRKSNLPVATPILGSMIICAPTKDKTRINSVLNHLKYKIKILWVVFGITACLCVCMLGSSAILQTVQWFILLLIMDNNAVRLVAMASKWWKLSNGLFHV